jgi:N6-adenosine-specific RNA methylase IME4
MSKIEERAVDTIYVPPERMKDLREEKVLALMESIPVVGLINPISVRRAKGIEIDGEVETGGITALVAGLHRLEAFRRLQRPLIDTIYVADDELRAELIQIDENLIRNTMTPAQEAKALARRKEIYEALHPETKAGQAQALGMHAALGRDVSAPRAPTFAVATAAATGRSRRYVQETTKRGRELPPETLDTITHTSLDQAEELDALAKLSPERQAQVVARAAAGEKVSAKIALKQERRDGKEVALAAKQRALPDKKFGLIYVDIPRHFHVHSDETGMDRSPENHYPTMTFDELLDLPVPQLAADDCILVYWSTAASLPDDIELMAEWGFFALRPRDGRGKLVRPNGKALPPVGDGSYRSMQVWDKVRMGLGYWFRDRHEFMLIGVRGNVVPPAPGTQDPSLFTEEKTEHSAKPKRPQLMMGRLWPNVPKLEMFARVDADHPPPPGWDVWGYEAEAETILAPADAPPAAPDLDIPPWEDAPPTDLTVHAVGTNQ